MLTSDSQRLSATDGVGVVTERTSSDNPRIADARAGGLCAIPSREADPCPDARGRPA